MATTKRYRPADYLRGSTQIGKKYTAYDTYGQGRPDFGAGAGPGEPYHEVQKIVRKPAKPPKWVPPQASPLPSHIPNLPGTVKRDPRIDAIRRRLGWA